MIENDDDSFPIFHNNLISLSKNFENLQSSILDEVVFNFNVIGITETKINDSKAPNSPCLVTNLNLSQRLSLSVALECLLMRHFITPSYIRKIV